jgi:hypothetical protein
MPVGNDITNMIRFIRMDIGDDGSTQTFSDTQLMTMVAKSTSRVDSDLGLGLPVATSGGYVQFVQASSGSTFLPSGTFTLPSDSINATLPETLFNLISLKTECLLAKRAHFDAAGKAIRVRDGDTEIDTSVGFAGLAQLTSGKGGPCDEYEKMLANYLKWLATELGNDITTYAAIIWKGSVRKTASHVEVGIDGNPKTEVMADFSSYLESPGSSNNPSTTEPNNRLGPDRNS